MAKPRGCITANVQMQLQLMGRYLANQMLP